MAGIKACLWGQSDRPLSDDGGCIRHGRRAGRHSHCIGRAGRSGHSLCRGHAVGGDNYSNPGDTGGGNRHGAGKEHIRGRGSNGRDAGRSGQSVAAGWG